MSRTIIVDDTDSGIQYGGAWSALTSALSDTNPEYLNTIHESHQLGDTITYTFTGTRIKVYCSLSSPGRNKVPSSTYKIDSGTPVRFNTTGDVPNVTGWTSNISHMPFYTSPELSDGQHTITITVDAVTSTGPSFYFDFFAVTTSNWQAGPNVIVDDTETAYIQYGPAWIQQGGWREFSSSARQTPGAINGTSVFKFQGTSISAYATLNGNYRSIPAIAAFALDDRPVQLYGDVSSSAAIYHQRIFHVDGLADNVEHRLSMTAIVIPGVPAWFFDYFVFTPSSAPITSTVPDPGSSVSTPATGGSVSTSGTSSAMSGTSSGTASQMLTTINGVAITLPGDVQQASPSTGSSSQQGGNSSSPPTSAIIGGIVGGVAVLVLILFAFFWRRRHQQRYGPLYLREKGQIDGSTTNFLAMQRIPGSESNLSSLNDDSSATRGRPRPADDLVYRMTPPPVKGRFTFAREEEGVNRGAQRQTMFSSSVGDAPLSPSATSSSVPGMSQSEEPDDTVVSETPPGAAPSPQQRESDMQRQRQSTTLRVHHEALKSPTPSSSSHYPSTTATATFATATTPSTDPVSSAHSVSRVPVREVDAGIRLDSQDLDDDVPDTLPPLYSRFR
ncbi:hypothetical protein M408DRAFT_28638 [Serendipita vermifera MAFF 305830]|uniref:Transmembrane protein n=1 Tax=Serendipita vermifera MAFF 305830 TaxID=933852 RepID=A0A0C2WYV9_SERVB|nr:hypothetical protein M408DRAFT_28638 [Serendipita vermifera MAFF 305830]